MNTPTPIMKNEQLKFYSKNLFSRRKIKERINVKEIYSDIKELHPGKKQKMK